MHEKLFPSQHENEQILLVARGHWLPLAMQLLIIAVLAALPIALNYFFKLEIDNFYSSFQSVPLSLIVQILAQVYYIILFITAFIVFVIYYLNVHILSEERIVDIDQTGLLSHVVSELNLESIEDVTSENIGLLGNLFDYGNVYVQTAGATERFEFNKVPVPSNIAAKILAAYEKHTNKPLKP